MSEDIQRLDKAVSSVFSLTRSEAKKAIRAGSVTVNGVALRDGALQVDPSKDVLALNGKTAQWRKFVYIMMNKPAGYLSATEDKACATVLDLLSPQDIKRGVFPAGRLDKDSEGFLLLTDDGNFAHEMISPKKHVPKRYVVTLDHSACDDDIAAFKSGITLDDGYLCMSAGLEILPDCRAAVTLVEGKFHQVKRMFEARGNKVLYLKRISIGNLQLDDSLALGESRYITDEELLLLKGENV